MFVECGDGREEYDDVIEVCCGGRVYKRKTNWMCCGGEYLSEEKYACFLYLTPVLNKQRKECVLYSIHYMGM